MQKLCIFCGRPSVSKTKEHIIPQWLIKLTGDPKRVVNFGFNWYQLKAREFSFDQFTFPSCNTCNSNFKLLEDAAKEVVIEILNEHCLPDIAISIFLTWLDKIRTGLWLGCLYLDRNPFGIKPNFYIENRIGSTDRMILIYKTNDTQKGISFYNITNPYFILKPSSFCFVVNQFYFLNIATNFLFSRRLGLPFLINLKWKSNIRKVMGQLSEGKGHIYYPLIKKYYDKTPKLICQPIIEPPLLKDPAYNNDYVKKFFPNSNSNLGRILIENNGKIVFYDHARHDWKPQKSQDRITIEKSVFQTLHTFQDLFIEEMPNVKALGKYGQNIKTGILLSNKYWDMVNHYLDKL